MSKLIACALLVFPAIGLAQAPRIAAGSIVYIEPAMGFENYLLTAFLDLHVPVAVVTDKSKAEYIIKSTVSTSTSSGHLGGEYTSMSFNILVIDPKSSPVVFAYSTGEYAGSQMKYAAEECAQQLKKFIEKPKK